MNATHDIDNHEPAAMQPLPVTQEADAKAQPVSRWSIPALDVLHKDGDYRLVLDVPGVTADGLEIVTERGVLTLTARREDAPSRGYRRQLRLPDHVDTDSIVATLANGVLTVDLPRHEAARPRTIPVVSR